MTIREAIANATQLLTDAGIAEPRVTAQQLLAALLKKDRAYLITHSDDRLEPSIADQFQTWVTQRCRGVPLQYITGHEQFYGLDFLVTPDVLIPRPETELLVQEALLRLQEPAPLIIDVGTGSGCLAITLAVHRPSCRVLALDISEAALRIARLNARRHHVEDRIEFLISDVFSGLTAKRMTTKADLIVSNPPYVAEHERDSLQREVREYEPSVALFAGSDGLAFHRRLLMESPAWLRPGGYLIMEMGFGQHQPMLELVDRSTWLIESIVPDLQAIERIIVLRLTAQG